MRLDPIPIEALTDNMAVKVPKASAKHGGEYEDAVTVSNVRFEETVNQRRTPYQLSEGSQGIVYMDAANSAGAFAVPVDSLVSVNGGDCMAVVACRPCKGLSEIHHWEIEVR
jgi:hypothetical protein